MRLLTYDRARIAAVRRDPSSLDGIAIVDDGLPPSFILDGAATALDAGHAERWHAPYAFVEARDGVERVVGSAIFKGEPDAGWVEIGYGVAAGHQRRGVATEGVAALVRLAFERPEVSAVYAETGVDNVASRRVVEKVGFTWAGQRASEDHGLVDCWFVER